VVTPRERFGVAAESLASLLETADCPFELVYVDGNSPAAVTAHVAEQSKLHGFRHIRLDRYLSPNEARNIGARAGTAPYVVFIDNDVICSDGWLSRLVRTAEETGAQVIAPLTCQGLPLHTEIHQAGAIFTHDLKAFFATPPGERLIMEEMHLQDKPLTAAPSGPVETQVCEFHCVLIRRDALEAQGYLDEEMLATKEHVDFCMGVLHAGGRVLLEPRSIVTYLFPCRARPMTSEDWPYFLVRWSEDWQRRSLDRLASKWGLKPGQHYIDDRKRKTRWRYDEGVVKPLMRKLPLPQNAEGVKRQARRVVSKAVALYGAALTREADNRMQDEREATRRSALLSRHGSGH
jgi:glycosyltransferase involved in cell wall biosynthesis